MKTSLVSIIMPAFNAEAYITVAIQSILKQKYNNWELLICDDASTDNTYNIIHNLLAEEKRARIFKNSKNLKLLKVRNNLLELVKGDFITFQDADDYSDEFRLEKMVNEFHANKRLGLVSSQVGYINEKGVLLWSSKKPSDYKSILSSIYSNNVVGGSIMMLRREVLKSVGGKFREYFDGLSYQDYDLSFLIAEKHECYCLPDVLYYYRQHGASASKIISIKRLLAKQIVIHLAKQRLNRGTDDIEDGYPEKVDEFFKSLEMPYKKDPSLIYREYAANFMYNHLYRKGIKAAWNAVKEAPFKFINWRTLQYCIRRAIIVKIF